jgi:post-segregation antitoxin (ccd killing protein)
MVKKMTISVPDELHEKAETWRNELNFSRLFQDALAKAVATKEAFNAALKGEKEEMAAIAGRLYVEREESHANRADAGMKDGVDWAKTAHYEDLLWLSEIEFIGDPRNRENEAVVDYFTQLATDFPIFEDGALLEEYAEAWREGVQAFWNEIQPLIDKV